MHQSFRCVPEIVRSNLASTLLKLATLNVMAPTQYPFMSRPSPQFFAKALKDLQQMNVFSKNGSLTAHGEKVKFPSLYIFPNMLLILQVRDFPLDPDLANLMVVSARSAFHCSKEMMTIVAIIAADCGRLFYFPNSEVGVETSVFRKLSDLRT